MSGKAPIPTPRGLIGPEPQKRTGLYATRSVGKEALVGARSPLPPRVRRTTKPGSASSQPTSASSVGTRSTSDDLCDREDRHRQRLRSDKEDHSEVFELEGPDLSALICSVEHDILLLEQLEVRSSDRRGSLPLPLSFMSSDLLSLPGYRPRKDSRNFGEPVSRENSPPSAGSRDPSPPSAGSRDPSPPSSGSRDQSPPCTPPPARVPPPQKAVINPGYDALLYRRLYNTPPPPLPPKSGRRRRNSDSAVSDCSPSPPSPATPMSPAESYLANQLAQHTARPREVFCPLCLAVVNHPDQLHTHLLATHPQELHLLRLQEFSAFRPETCPCCSAQFLRAGLGLRHIVHQHPEFICGLFSPALNLPTTPSLPRSLPATPPPQRHTFCRVCGQKFLLKQIRLLSLHYYQQHLRQLNNVIARLSPRTPDSCFSEEHHYTDPRPGENILLLAEQRILSNNYMAPAARRRLDTPINQEDDIQQFESPSQHRYESIDSPEIGSPPVDSRFVRSVHHGSLRARWQDSKRFKKTEFTGTLRGRTGGGISQVDRPQSRSGSQPDRRRGRTISQSEPERRGRTISQSEPERRDRTPQRSKYTRSFRREGGAAAAHLTGLETYQGLPQPEPPSMPITGIGSESNLLEPEQLGLNYARYGTDLLFRCNLCGERFAENPVLLDHLKSRHLAVSRALKPQYSCGRCPARFFKNSFLLKHSSTHVRGKN